MTGDGPRLRRRALRKGRWAETAAAALLILGGYRILARNYAMQGGEIDMVVLRGDTVAFVEVKARDDAEAGLWSIGPEKQRRIRRAAAHWVSRNPWASTRTLRGDAVVVVPFRLPRHVPDAFSLEG
jgi:putative endonuclease